MAKIYFSNDVTEPTLSVKYFFEIRMISKLNQTDFAKKYHIPLRTVQNWEGGVTTPPIYVLELLEKVVNAEREAAENA